MTIPQSCCTHPTGSESIWLEFRRCKVCKAENTEGLTSCFSCSGELGPVIQRCSCPICNYEWDRLRGAGGEFV